MLDTMKTLAEKVTHLRTVKGWTQGELAAAVGVTQGSIGNIESGIRENPRAATILGIAKVFGVSPQWLQSGEGPMHAGTTEAAPTQAVPLDDNPQYPAIRRVKFKLSAGASGFGVDYLDEQDAPIVFRREWFDRNGYRPERLFAVRVANGSMEPGLWHGDTVVVNTDQTEPRDGAVFAVNYEGELVIKRLVRDGGQWWLCSDNPDQRRYPRKACDEHAYLLGEIVHKQSEKI